MTAQQIRTTFLEFFKSKQHTIVPSAPMVVKNDPTLMFTNAGMNQFKDYFLGNTTPTNRRVADTQKCLRVSGKHNDLEEVGHDTYHHTMFEMLGNWSFGNYFKKEAIAFAWELLVDVYKIDKSRMYASVFEGDKEANIDADNEALELWKQYLPENQIIYGNKKDNFWEMGDTGPCGPCTEIHIDLRSDEERAKVEGASLVNKDVPTVIEIWNLVFIQFNRKANGSLEPLPEKHVDTGMGFERLCMVLQGKTSNYDTDVFQPLIQKISALSGVVYGAAQASDIAMRVIADHLRAICFSIADGQLPSNVKAGYVIRRILRRAVRYGFTFLNLKEPFLGKLVATLAQQMGDNFTELKAQQQLIEKVITEEETTFLRTLEIGIKMLDAELDKLQAAGQKQLNGKTAFELYDTYGFPYDLTDLMAREKGFSVDEKAFDKELETQKERSRNAAVVETGDWEEVSKATDCSFVGYDKLEVKTKIARYRKVKSKGKEQVQIVLEQTPFYAESGGQVGDEGWLICAGERVEVLNTQKENNLHIQIVNSLPKDLKADIVAKVDADKRTLIANHHTATHLMHYALRKILGTHVEQKGSLVAAHGLRFDFSHFQKLTPEQIQEVERMVNAMIRQTTPVQEFRSIPIEQAKEMGAMALFGEKYGDSVRVLQIDNSIELCGGTHANSTGQIGYFKIVSEVAVSAGIRRIEAVTGEYAEKYIYNMQYLLNNVKSLFNTPDLAAAVKKVVDENADLQKQMNAFRQEKTAKHADALLKRASNLGDYKLIELRDESMPAHLLKDLAFQIRANAPQTIVLAAIITVDSKPLISVLLPDDLVKKGLNASQMVREAAVEIGGSGGGQAFFATAGGKNTEGLHAAFEKLLDLIKRKV
ncbi:MAG: alanine--tRNA ligase [Bacteroidales bacterium]